MTNEVDWDDVLHEQESDPANKPVPSGWQDVSVVKAEATVASTGSPMIKLTVEVQGGPYDSRFVWTNLVFKTDSSTNMRMVLRSLSAFGLGAEYLAANKPTMSQLADALMGRQAQADVFIRRYNDEDLNDVKIFRPLVGGPTVAASPSVGLTTPPPPPVLPDEPSAGDVPPVPAPSEAESPFRGKGDPSEPF